MDEAAGHSPSGGTAAMDGDAIPARLDRPRAADLPVHGGRTMAYVYVYDSGLAGLDELAARAQAAFAGVNGLDMTAFPSVVALENDVVGQAARLLGGGPGTAHAASTRPPPPSAPPSSPCPSTR